MRLLTLGEAALLRPGDTEPLLAPGKPLALFSYLALAPGRSASREFLLELLWADADPEHGRHALRQVLWQLRQVLGEGCLGGREEIVLTCPVESDRDDFTRAVESGDLDGALSLYRGPFFPNFASPGGAAFEQWSDLERERLRSIYLRTTETVIRRRLLAGRARECIVLARRIRELGGEAALAHRLAIDAHLALADVISAAGEAQALEQWAASEGVPLDAASRDAIRRARQEDARAILGNPSANGAPQLVADLVGREHEFARALGVWEAVRRGESRHLHIVAPAGLGKTRLLQDLRARLLAARGQAKYVRANPGDRAIPGALLGDLAEALASLPGAPGISRDSAGTLVALDPSLSARYDVTADPATGDDVPRRRSLALTELISAVAHERPFALLIDDLHWADADSLAVIEAVIARVNNVGVMIVTATRPTPGGQLRSEKRETMLLAPLTATQIGDLLSSLGQFEATAQRDRLAEQLLSASGGSPLLVLDLVTLAMERELLTLSNDRWIVASQTASQVVFSQGEGIRQRLSRLGEPARQLLLALSVAGAPLPEPIIGSTLRIETADVSGQLLQLERRGLVHQRAGGWETAHDEIAETVLQLWSDGVSETQQGLASALAEIATNDRVWLPHAARLAAASGDHATFARMLSLELDRTRLQHPCPPIDAVVRRLAGSHSSRNFSRRAVKDLPWRTRARLARWPRSVTIVVTAVLALSITGWLSRREPALLLVTLWRDGSQAGLLAADPDRPGRDGVLASHALPLVRATGTLTADRLQIRGDISPGGDSVLVAGTLPDSSNIDLFLVSGGKTRQLTDWRKDDLRPRFAPGDSEVIFLTSRWSPPGADLNQLAVLNLTTNEVRRLTNSPTLDGAPFQSPDGTRVAFVRNFRDARGLQLCIVTWDGKETGCVRTPGYTPADVVGWIDASTIVLQADTLDRAVLLSVDAASGKIQLLKHDHTIDAVVSPDGRYVACRCERDPEAGEELEVFPVTSPKDGYRVPLKGAALPEVLLWQSARREDRAIDTIRIRPSGIVEVGAIHTLHVRAANRNGQPVAYENSVVRWSSGRPEVASIDSITGSLIALRTGTTWIRATAGGWRTDSASVTVEPSSARRVLEESWQGFERRWRVFGDPLGRVMSTKTFSEAFVNSGDGTFQSGAYLLDSLDPSRGVTVEAMISTPVNRMTWQYLSVGLQPHPPGLSRWDHRSGQYPSTPAEVRRTCNFGYPAGEFSGADTIVELSAGNRISMARVPFALRTGEPYLLRLSLFADGSCGIAINGKAIQRSRNSVPIDRPLHLWIMGSSVDTKMAVGPLKIWLGDPGGVDWSVLKKDGIEE